MKHLVLICKNFGYYLGYRILDDNKYTLDYVLPPLTADTISDWDMSEILLSKKNEYFVALANGNDISINEIGPSIIQILSSAGNPPMQNLVWPNGYYGPTSEGNVLLGQAKATVDLIGSEYLLFVINDYTQSFPNNGLVTISKLNTKLDIPTYAYELGQDYSANICDHSANSATLTPTISQTQFIPTFPRKLTQAQLYSVNQIINNRRQSVPQIQAPNPPDLFATINLTRTVTGAVLYEDYKTEYMRTYFGPVTLDRLGIKLLDDKGNLVNFTWS